MYFLFIKLLILSGFVASYKLKYIVKVKSILLK